jgi:hypothetical protein
MPTIRTYGGVPPLPAGAHHDANGGGGDEEEDYGRVKNWASTRKKGSKKARKQYPKRQGGKFRARTAGG